METSVRMLESVIGGAWMGERRSEGKRTDTDKGVERAVRVVQAAAGAMLLRWHKMGARARRWAARREAMRGRASVVLHAWRTVCERQQGNGGWVADRRANARKARTPRMS